MKEKILVEGTEAVGWGAVSAGVDAFFGYPITPQNETTEWFAREMPKRGKVFVQAQSEVGAIHLIYGGAATGARVITSTSGPGWSLMQEGMSTLVEAEFPCVVVLMQRGGPGEGTVRHSQMDYMTATRGGGHGGYKNIVLAPASVQETSDLVQTAFYLADKYRNPVVILTDGIIGRTRESLEVRTLDFSPLPEKDWAVRGKGQNKDGQRRVHQIIRGALAPSKEYDSYLAFIKALADKFQQMKNEEVRYESYQAVDAHLILVSFGYVARVCKEAINMARAEGLRVGLIRPISLWPFPSKVIAEKAEQGAKFLVVEDNLGLMVEDVELAVRGKAQVHLLNMLAHHLPTDAGMILPDRVFEEVKKLL